MTPRGSWSAAAWRAEQAALLRSLAQMQSLCVDRTEVQLCAHVDAIDEAFRDHAKRVDALLRGATAVL